MGKVEKLRNWALVVLVFLATGIGPVGTASPSGEAACPDTFHLSSLAGTTLTLHDAIQFGETHGTVQSPAAFYEFVCRAARTAPTPLVVAVEQPAAAVSAARRASTASSPRAAARALARSTFWSQARDGRTSQAYYRMLVQLFALERRKEIVVVGLDRRTAARPMLAEAAADLLLAQRKHHPASPLLVYTGIGHARFDGTPNSLADALVARGLRTLAVSLLHSGGSAWVCTDGDCGPIALPPHETCRTPGVEAAGVTRRDARRATVAVCLGPMTPSPPQWSDPMH